LRCGFFATKKAGERSNTISPIGPAEPIIMSPDYRTGGKQGTNKKKKETLKGARSFRQWRMDLRPERKKN